MPIEEAEATGGGHQIVMPPSYPLTTVANGFRLPIGGGLINVLPPKENSCGSRQLGGGSN